VTLDRRSFLAVTTAAMAGRAHAATEPPKVAIVFTEWFYRSHAHVLLENFLQPYLFRGQAHRPGG
jgi:hypothetical protein